MKTIFITGASSGIGKATATYFHAKGWNVAATMRSPEKETELTRLPNIKCFALEVTDVSSVKAAVAGAIAAFGTIDVVFNNAGFSLIGPFETTPVSDITRQYETNVFGLMNVVREVLPFLRTARSGVIVNVASVGGRIGFPLYSLYNSTKFAVEGFSEAIRYELEPLGIRVKIIEPGVIKTDFYGRSMGHTGKQGNGDYDPWAAKAHEKLMAVGNNGLTSGQAARKIYKAATSRSRRLRYSIGPDAKALLFIRRMLPFRVLGSIVRGLVR